MAISNRNMIVHSNLITKAKYKLNALEMKFISLIVAQINSVNGKEFNNYSIKISDLEEHFNAQQNYSRIYKNFAKQLLSKPFEIPSSNANGGWIVLNWFSSIEYIKNEARIECSIDQKLKPFLLELKNYFTKYDLKQYVQLNSIYAMRLFQYFNMLETEIKGYIDLNVEDLQERLQVPKSLLRYDNFKRQAIETALREINAKTDLYIEYKVHEKFRKKVILLRFYITKKTDKFEEYKNKKSKQQIFIDRAKKKKIKKMNESEEQENENQKENKNENYHL